MLRNKQTEKQKALRRMYERYRDISWRAVDYVPVEKPYFMGWDVSIALSESGARRRDADELQAVLDALGASRKQFTKGVRFIRYLRRWRYSLDAIEHAHVMDYKKGRDTKPHWFQSLAHYSLSKHAYANLPVHIQKYFYYDKSDYYYWGKYGDCYRLRFPFPTYELIYKVEKAYANFQGIPRADEWSEWQHLSNILEDNHYWSAKNGFPDGYRQKHWDRQRNVITRRTWKKFCHVIKNTDLSYEAEEQETRFIKKSRKDW